MTIDLSTAQREDVLHGKSVTIPVPELGRNVVLIDADVFAAIQDDLEELRDQLAWDQCARKQAAELAEENPY
jgi:hypothetical protein